MTVLVPKTTKQRIVEKWTAGADVRQIAEALSCSTQNVYYHLHSLGIDPTDRPASDGDR